MTKKSISKSNIDQVRHTLSHLLAHAVLDQFPNAKLGIGPTIDNGFYYDFDLDRPLTPADLKPLEKRMKHLIKQNLVMQQVSAEAPVVKQYVAEQPFKQELIEELKSRSETPTLYQIGQFTDLCRGGHITNTKEINPDVFALTQVAGAYWRGDSSKPMLQRIYGVAFATTEELAAYQSMLLEAAKRDHKKLGQELDLFTFSDLVGSGLPLWTPKGTLLRILLDDFVWQLRRAAGYERVEIPHLAKKDLYVRSGHWDKFQDELFKINTREKHLFAMKPMNCPHHTQIYARHQHSYRDLPQRYCNTTMCYRDEQTGELSGLARLRAFTQDDAHVFCRMSQTPDEITAIWNIITAFYKPVGFELKLRLSLHDPAHPEKYLGEPKLWTEAEAVLRRLVKQKKAIAEEAIGEAAFYGPKLDFMAKDSLGREWQVATIQLDMNLPERFDLSCVNEQGEHERIVMLHCAIMGSIERYLAILIEHFAGAFPLWLSPVQIQIIPVSSKHNAIGRKLMKQVSDAGLRAFLDDSNESVGYKIRRAEKSKAPYMIVVGDKEKTLTKLQVRVRGQKNVKTVTLKSWLPVLQNNIATRSIKL